MANYNWGFDYPMTACGDQNSNQWKFVQMASGGAGNTFEISSGGSGPAPIGVLQEDPESGQVGAVRILGVTKLMVNADTAITAGDFLTSSSTGHAIVTSTGSMFSALALETVSSGSGVIIRALLTPYGGGNMIDNTP